VAAKRRTAAARTEAVARAMAVAAAQRTSRAFGRWRLSACLCAARVPDVAHVTSHVAPSTHSQATTNTATRQQLDLDASTLLKSSSAKAVAANTPSR